jgi:hypothetical protein
MSKKIALIDYDVMFTRLYQVPNYDLAVTYNYLKKDKNIAVRLVAIATPKELVQYDEIYIFKNLKRYPHPSAVIENYYRLPIKEYGRGFINRPDRPFIEGTMDVRPDFKCYNPILKFSLENRGHGKAWKIKPLSVLNTYDHLKLYEKIGDEYLRKDIPNFKNKKIMIYDDLNVLFNTPSQVEYLREIMPKVNHLGFASQLDISLLNDTNILEWIILDKKFSSIRKVLLASTINNNVLWLVNYFIHNQCKQTTLKVLLEKQEGETLYLDALLTMNYWNNETGYVLRIKPFATDTSLYDYPLAKLAYKFLYETPFFMSFYEYLFFVGCKYLKVPQNLIHTDDETYEYIVNKYGIPKTLIRLEEWLRYHPEFEEHVFIGGSSNYEHIRRKTIDFIRGKTAFGERN